MNNLIVKLIILRSTECLAALSLNMHDKYNQKGVVINTLLNNYNRIKRTYRTNKPQRNF